MADAHDIEPVSLEDLQCSSRTPRSIPLVIIVGFAIAFTFVWSASTLQSANDRSRWCTVYSLVHLGTWQIDKIVAHDEWQTIDKVRHNGHFYSSKPAFLQAAVAGLYWCVYRTTGWNVFDDTEEVTHVILTLVNLIPTLIAWFLVNGMLVRYAREKYTRRLLLMAFIFATPITTFLVTLNNHVVAAWSIVFALSPALKVLIDGRDEKRLFLCSGFFAALAFVNELPALSFVGLLGLFLLIQSPRRTLTCYLPAVLIPIAVSVYLTYWQTGGWKPFYLFYGTEKYLFVHEGIPSYWINARGFDKNADSFPVYLFHCTFGHHGIFSLTPLFLFMPLAWIVPIWSEKKFRWVLGMSAVLTVVVLGFYLTRTNNYNYGGNTSTLRWLMWLVPIWTLSLIPVLDRFANTRTMHIFAGAFLAVGCFSTFWPIQNPWTAPWMFSLLDRYDRVEQYDDPIEPLDRQHYVWFSSLPETLNPESPEYLRLTCQNLMGEPMMIQLSDLGREGNLHRVRLKETVSQAIPFEIDLTIDAEKFAAGEKIDDWLIEPSAEESAEQRELVMTLLRGFPKTTYYRPGRRRYIRTSLREDAFTVQHAASRTRTRPQEEGLLYEYRCDTWYCEDLPFGVAQVKFTVKRVKDDVVVSEQLFRVDDASSFPPEASPPQTDGE
ncbi:MAG: hypothetical protein HUJ26_22365 [Planctomycetaceae bacterium]|nr:hypothetical protein [Planctomycetaceae bacterium]